MELVTKVPIRFSHQNEQQKKKLQSHLHSFCKRDAMKYTIFFILLQEKNNGSFSPLALNMYAPNALPHGKTFACTAIQRFANYFFMLQFMVNLENTFNWIHCILLVCSAYISMITKRTTANNNMNLHTGNLFHILTRTTHSLQSPTHIRWIYSLIHSQSRRAHYLMKTW